MQSFLSRAVTARTSCRCFSCGQAAKTVTRRNVNATKRRRVGANDVFTACYSSLMASAVIADAEVKRDRRKKWDQAIEDARTGTVEVDAVGNTHELGDKTYSPISASGISITPQQEHTVQYTPLWSADAINFGDISRSSKSRLDNKLQSIGQGIQRNLDGRKELESEHEDWASEPVVVKEEDLEKEYTEADICDWADELPIPGFSFRGPMQRSHVDKTEDGVNLLVAQILQHVSIFNDSHRFRPSDSFYKAQQVLDKITEIQNGFFRVPNYEFRNDEAYASARSELHTSLYRICQQATQEKHDIDWMLSKICYNLLVAPVPPSIITFNILLGELDRMQQHDVAELVVQTYFNNTKLSPTFDTMRLMLDHYVKKNDYNGFEQIRNRMRGVAIDQAKGSHLDMRLGRRRVKELYDPHVQEWARNEKVIRRNEWLVRQAPRDQQVFDSLIMGSLAFGKTRQAIRCLGDAASHSEVRSEWICSIASKCLKSFDHRGARRLFQYLVKHWVNSTGNLLVPLSRDVRHWILQILALVGMDLSRGDVLFPKLHFLGVFEQEAHAMLLDVYLESAREQIESLGRAIAAMSSSLLESTESIVSTSRDLSGKKIVDLELKTYDAEMASLASLRPKLRKTYLGFVSRRVGDSVVKSEELYEEVSKCLKELSLYGQTQLSSPMRQQNESLATYVSSIPTQAVRASSTLHTSPGSEALYKQIKKNIKVQSTDFQISRPKNAATGSRDSTRQPEQLDVITPSRPQKSTPTKTRHYRDHDQQQEDIPMQPFYDEVPEYRHVSLAAASM